MRILVVTAHPDDVDFGAGGTIRAMTQAGIQVSYCLVTDGDAGGFDPMRVPRQTDLVSRYLTVQSSHRVTWTPPKCACPTYRVWLYGGSTVFGTGQREFCDDPYETFAFADMDAATFEADGGSITFDLEAQRLDAALGLGHVDGIRAPCQIHLALAEKIARRRLTSMRAG